MFFFPRDVLDEIWDLIESVSEGFPTYSSIHINLFLYHLQYKRACFENSMSSFHYLISFNKQ